MCPRRHVLEVTCLGDDEHQWNVQHYSSGISARVVIVYANINMDEDTGKNEDMELSVCVGGGRN